MQKVPFTPLGFQTLLQQLYALDDAALYEEIRALEYNFEDWLTLHFDFDEQQLRYLQNMDDEFLEIIEEQSVHHLIKRLPIALMREEKKKDDDVGKLFEVSQTERNIYTLGSGIKKVETLIFTISYSF